MSKISPAKCLSPIKKMRKGHKSFERELFNSPKSSISLPSCLNEKEFRARAIIRKLLEDEADRSEELSEENEILEAQIKALVLLLVEKDQKLELIKREDCRKNRLFEIVEKWKSRMNGFSFRMIQKFSRYWKVNGLSRSLRVRYLEKWGKSLLRRKICQLFYGIRENIEEGYRNDQRTEGSFGFSSFFCEKKKDAACKILAILTCKGVYLKKIGKAFAAWKQSIVQTDLSSTFQFAESILRFNKETKKPQWKDKFLPICIRNIINDTLMNAFSLIQVKNETQKSMNLKAKNRLFLVDFTKNSKLSIIFTSLNSIILRKDLTYSLRLFQSWKRKKSLNFHVFHIVEALQKVLQKRLSISKIFYHKSSPLLPCTIKKLFLKQLQNSISQLKINLLQAKNLEIASQAKSTSEEISKISESLSRCSLEIESFNAQYKEISLEIAQEKTLIENLQNKCSNAENLYKNLLEEFENKVDELSLFKDKSISVQLKLDQTGQQFQEKAKKQIEYLKAVNSKLQQLIAKHDKVLEENNVIMAKNSFIENSIQKLHESYSAIVDEKFKAQVLENDSKLELNSLISTSQALDEEIYTLKAKIKHSNSQLMALKEEFVKRLQSFEGAIAEAKSQQEKNSKILIEIHEIGQDIQAEYETKELKINECSIEIQDLKEALAKSREDIESIKYQIKDLTSKAKDSKTTENYKSPLQTLRNTFNSLSSNNTHTEKEISGLENNLKQHKEVYDKKLVENQFLENKISQISRSLQESKKSNQRGQKSKEELQGYIRTLELQVNKLNGVVSRHNSYEIENNRCEVEILVDKANRLEKELWYVNEEASQRRQEVAQIMPEIENYANILAAIEGKIAENEGKIAETEQDTDRTRSEIKALKSRYFALKSELR